MKIPKKTKYKKFRKVRLSGSASACNTLSFGTYGVKVLNNIKIDANQIEAIRKVLNRTLKRLGILYIRVFPHLPITKKSLGVRGGGGKGAVEKWVYPAKKGTILFEIDNVSEELAIKALQKVKYKISAECKIIKRKFVYIN